MPAAYWDYPGAKTRLPSFAAVYIAELLHDIAGYGGTKMLRRMMGIVSVWDISSIEDPEMRAVAERLAIRIGTRWVLESERIADIDDLIDIVCEESQARQAG